MFKQILVFLLIVLVVAGCSASPGWQASLQTSDEILSGQVSPFIIEVTKDGKPVTGLQVSGRLEMERMDHGVTEVQLTETGEGKYAVDVNLPMNGEWIAEIHMTDGSREQLQTVSLQVQ